MSLGILAPPGAYGADIVVGSIQPLGIHMNCGGGLGGFIASRDEPRYAHEYPTLLISIAQTHARRDRLRHGLMHQSSYGSRENGKDWTGNSTYLWAIASAVYMSRWVRRVSASSARPIIQRAHYAAKLLAAIRGVRVRQASGLLQGVRRRTSTAPGGAWRRSTPHCSSAASSAAWISRERFPELGQSALYCVTEVHSVGDIDRLAGALQEVCAR